MRGRFRHSFLVLAVGMATALPATALAAPGEDFGRRMDRALERSAAQFGPAGVQAVAIRDGRVLWSGTRGQAVNEPVRPVTGRTTFAYASLSKLMLSAFALRQVENRVLELDRPIAAYVGDEVAGSRVVTVRMLLQHTAGYPDLYADPATAPLFPPGEKYDPNRPYTFAMLNAGIREPVNPGANYAYSNTGYLVLGQVLTKVFGGTEAFSRAHEQFLRRAGTPRHPVTAHQVTLRRDAQALRHLAHGHNELPDGTLQDYQTAYGAKGIPTDLFGLPFTDGHIAGTATGAALVLDGLFVRDALLSQESVRQMVTPTPQSAGHQYGMGTNRTTAHGRTWQGHGGAYGGFNSMAGTDRERGLTIVVVANQLSAKAPASAIWLKLTEAAN